MKKSKNHLIQKFLENNLSENEAIQFKEWLDKPGNKERLKDDIQLNYLINIWLSKFDTAKAYRKNKQIRKKNEKKKRIPPYNLMKYAAIFIGLLGVAYFFYNSINTNPKTEQLVIPKESVVLELENGRAKKLLPNKDQIITNKTGEEVSIKKGDTLIYRKSAITKPVYHTLNVPYGKTHKLLLSDSSFVHLNSGSKIRFPTSFTGKSRTVYLQGEAYFEINHDDKSNFIVNTEHIGISVLGTKFNVSSYPSDLTAETVLLEGSVALSGKKFTSQILKPGEMGLWDIDNNEFHRREVEVDDYIAWTKGQFLFHKKPFKEILKVLERKYNVTIKNNYPELNNGRYKGKFDEESIDEVMKTFTESRLFDYYIKDNKIIIEKPKEP